MDDRRNKESIIVCSCFEVSAGEVHNAIQSGCRNFSDVMLVTQAGTRCKECQAAIVDLLEQHGAVTASPESV